MLTYLHTDHLGSVVATSSAATRPSSTSPTASRGATGLLPTDHAFTGQPHDASGLVYMNARYYDPAVGQFASPDTLVPNPSVVMDYNRYAYARGNPLKYNDPSGHCATTVDEEGTTVPDMASDAECWKSAYAIYGHWTAAVSNGGADEQWWQNQWRMSPGQWWDQFALNPAIDADIMQQWKSVADNYFMATRGLTQEQGLPLGKSLHPIDNLDPKYRNYTYALITGDCSQIDCLTLALDATGVAASGLVVVASPLCGPAAPGCASAGTTVSRLTTALSVGLTAINWWDGSASNQDITTSFVTGTISISADPISGLRASIVQAIWDFFAPVDPWE